MPVFEGSRYQETSYTAITGRDLITRKWLHPRVPLDPQAIDTDWILHTVTEGDDLDLLAYLYTDENADKTKFWWIIADANNLLWPLDIEPGLELIIPIRELAAQGLR